MEVIAISPRGYCYGVVKALMVVKEAILKHPDKQIYIMGIIIHNKFVAEALRRKGVISLYDPEKTRLELLDDIDSGVIIFSAHGTPLEIIEKAKHKELVVYNAVCKDVVKTQDIVKEYLNKDYDVLYIGKENHPEALAIQSISERITLLTSPDDLVGLNIKDKTIITNQTTMSLYDTQYIVDLIVDKNPNVTVINEICQATRKRQEALFDLESFDLIYVVGDTLSNNSNNLAKVASKSVSNVKFIESVQDINNEDLSLNLKVGVTSGASTPTSITEQVISYLKKYPNVTDDDKVINYDSIL